MIVEHLMRQSIPFALLAVTLAIGCATTPTLSRKNMPRDPDLMDAQGGVERLPSPIDQAPRKIAIHLAFEGADARGQLLTESVDAGKIAQMACTECFVGSNNYIVVNSSALNAVAQQQQRVEGAKSTASDFLVLLTVGLKEREIRADGKLGEWEFLVGGAKETSRQRQGAVEVYAEVISIRDNQIVFVKQGLGYLDEIEQNKSGFWILQNTAQERTERTPVPTAIRKASRELAKEIDAFFASYLSELGIS